MGTNPPAQQPARSARAAGKAPAAAPANNAHNHYPPKASSSTAKGKAPATQPPAKIWTQSSIQDRDNIRKFWLELTELERRDLLQIEKDAVLKKMKEQHRHSCGCAVCGRKKVNIETELDSLYEQYYAELQLYAAEQRAASDGQRPQPAGAGPFPGSVEVDAAGKVTKFDDRAPDPNGQDDEYDDEGSEVFDDEDYEDEEEVDDEELGTEEGEPEDEHDHDHGHSHAPRPAKRQAAGSRASQQPTAPPPEGDDFFAFGSSLATIKGVSCLHKYGRGLTLNQGGILTVADDLLKNDGVKFLEMMEQLAVARNTREVQNLRDMQEETDDEATDDGKEYVYDTIELMTVSRPSSSAWMKGGACFKSLLRACLSSASCRRTAKRWHASARSSCC
jgi:hypothetical protein